MGSHLQRLPVTIAHAPWDSRGISKLRKFKRMFILWQLKVGKIVDAVLFIHLALQYNWLVQWFHGIT